MKNDIRDLISDRNRGSCQNTQYEIFPCKIMIFKVQIKIAIRWKVTFGIKQMKTPEATIT